MNGRNPYEDIMHLPHHVSKKRPPMSMMDRAGQFSPFAALTGHDDAIQETARFTDQRQEMDEDLLGLLGMKMQQLAERLDEQPEVTLTCFHPDPKKAGGAYVTVTGIVKKMDTYERQILLQDGRRISMDEIIAINYEWDERLDGI